MKGYSVCVLEQYNDCALQTSSRSTKLIHGGLRYLETFQFGLVHEALSERQTLLKIAPQLVKLLPFYLPVYKTSTRGSWKIKTGLTLYALLGLLRPSALYSEIFDISSIEQDGLNLEGLKTIFQF